MNRVQKAEASQSSSSDNQGTMQRDPVVGLRDYFSQSLSDRQDADSRIARSKFSNESVAIDWVGL